MKREAGSQEPGARSEKPGARSEKPGARSQEPGAGSQKPGARSQEPGARSREPGVRSQESESHPQDEPSTMKVLHADSGREMRGGQWQVLSLHQGLGAGSLLLCRAGGPLMQECRRRGLNV